MGWGGFTDPAEAAAAAEAAEKMEAARAEADGRTEALAAAILEGFAMLAAAIRAAAGITAPGLGEAYQGPLDGIASHWSPLATEDQDQDQPDLPADPDLDDLLSTDDQGQEKG